MLPLSRPTKTMASVVVPMSTAIPYSFSSGSSLEAAASERMSNSSSFCTRRRMTQAERAQVDEVLYVPAALALRQRPGVPGIRSTFGTGTELLNILRLMFSRLASHRCPFGHYVEPSVSVAAGQELVCPVCGSKNLTKIDRMNGYLSYSRVKGDTRLNEAKMAEIAERKSM